MANYSPNRNLTYAELFGTGTRTYADYGDVAEVEPPPPIGTVSRWRLTDPTNGDTMVFIIGPDTAPGYYGVEKNIIQDGMDLVTDDDGNFVFQPTLVEGGQGRKPVTFSGRALNAAQYLHLLYWYDKGHPIIITDDLEFEWEIFITDVKMERILSATQQWYFQWSLESLEV